MKKEVWDRTGGYSPLLRMTQDYDLHLKVLESFAVGKSRQSTVCYRMHGDNLSKKGDAYWNAVYNETSMFLASHYLSGVKSTEDLLAIIPECREYGEPVAEAIPYFLARFAVERGTEQHVRFAGLLALSRFMEIASNREMLEGRYGFLTKDFMRMSELPVFSVAHDLTIAKSSLELMSQSFSYRLGLALTWPARTIYRSFRPLDAV